MTVRTTLAALAATGVMAVAGCGGGSTDQSNEQAIKATTTAHTDKVAAQRAFIRGAKLIHCSYYAEPTCFSRGEDETEPYFDMTRLLIGDELELLGDDSTLRSPNGTVGVALESADAPYLDRITRGLKAAEKATSGS